MVKMICKRPHSSTLYGNVEEGAKFDVPEGYVKQLENEGLAYRPAAPAAPAAPKRRQRR